MASNDLKKKMAKKKKSNNSSNPQIKSPLSEKKNLLTVTKYNDKDNYSTDGYSSNVSENSDITDSYPNSLNSDSETESQLNSSNNIESPNSDKKSDLNSPLNKVKSQAVNAKNKLLNSRPYQYYNKHRRHHQEEPKSLLAFRRVYFILGIVIGACTIYFATKKMDEYKDMSSVFKNSK